MIRIVSYTLICLMLILGSCGKEVCDDTCYWAMDGECDDGGDDSLNDFCEIGTDCADCGTRTVK
ncbi:MAG: hypothetical protein HN542_01015 [Flavobacteriales bacterium]|jgi:hypothetical protein|nr:hypothetical protein [Flavobacteriales bacterium]MBT3964748.1 hypothetical protein [Flavobacteriales bacterium]MBT4706237.1 hypothetical protein [Flavobacteriales bacterium]MBT4931412.1 hypothetical protein [Flavobacteriales bacterium]MBT5131524.1 hypothetical protein [Flavobacteriales bacterium]